MSITTTVTRNVTRGVTWSLSDPGGWAAAAAAGDSYLLIEIGDKLLLEDADSLLLE